MTGPTTVWLAFETEHQGTQTLWHLIGVYATASAAMKGAELARSEELATNGQPMDQWEAEGDAEIWSGDWVVVEHDVTPDPMHIAPTIEEAGQ